jgi:hypothetical protein
VKLYFEKAELPAAITLSESTIDEEIRQGRFPRPRQLAGRHRPIAPTKKSPHSLPAAGGWRDRRR